MDSSIFRLLAQVALTTWAVAEIAMLVFVRNRIEPVTGTRWAILGLVFFSAWMFALSISIYAVAIVPRGSLVWLFVFLEMGTAVGAWGWLIANSKMRFKIEIHSGRCQKNGDKAMST
jgi:hypothetical protein